MMLDRQSASVEEGRVEGGREGGLMKGTSEEGTGRGMGSGREEASGGGIERGMEGEQGMVIKGRYPEEDTVYSQTIPQRGPFN